MTTGVRRRRGLLLVVVVAAASGCGLPGTPGERGVCGFVYSCSDSSDLACDAEHYGLVFSPDDPVPSRVGVNGLFHLAAECGTAATAVPASPLHVDGGSQVGFRLLDAGYHSFLAREPDGEVRDFVHVHASEVASVHIWKGVEEASSLDIHLGQEVVVSVRPGADDGVDLAGAFAYAWQTADPLVASVAKVEGDNKATLFAEAPGTVQIQVSLAELSDMVEVTVLSP